MHYQIHDNGGLPFKVVIHGNLHVDIYKYDCYDSRDFGLDEDGKTVYEENPFFSVTAMKIFVGESQPGPASVVSGEEYDGNTLLIRIGKNKYIFVGPTIYSFTSLSEIVDYYSPVGNNDVSYPYAKDIKGNYYLFVENVILYQTDDLDTKVKDDPYTYFYGMKHLGVKAFVGKIEDDNHYNLSYTSDPKERYESLTEDGQMYFKENRELLSKKTYIQMMKNFEKDNHIGVIQTEIIADRQ